MLHLEDFLNFEHYLTPSLIRIFYLLQLAMIGLFTVSNIFAALAAMLHALSVRLHLARRHAGRRRRRRDRGADLHGNHHGSVSEQRTPGRDPRPRRGSLSREAPQNVGDGKASAIAFRVIWPTSADELAPDDCQMLIRKSEMHDIAVLDDIILAFEA